LSVHIGSQIQSLAPFKKAFNKIKKQVKELRNLGFKIDVLDLGGGIGIRYKQEDKIIKIEDYCKLIEDLFIDMKLEIIIEPGRFIVGSSGLILSTIIRVKKGERKLFLIIDAGMNNLIRPAMYNANHEIIPVIKKNTKRFKYDFVGPICETSDVFSKNIPMQELKKEDGLVICSTGAYGSCMSSDYNLRGLAKEIFVKKNKIFEN
jgi:diaminopimelate decarboxylase